MAKEMLSCRIDSDLRDALAAEAAGEGRSVSNMLGQVLRERYAVLEERGGAARKALVSRADAGTAGASLGDGADLGPTVSVHVPRSSSSVSPGAENVVVRPRPHMKANRPAVECPTRVAAGEVCPDCGAVGRG